MHNRAGATRALQPGSRAARTQPEPPTAPPPRLIPRQVASDFARLEARFPARVLLGIGIGHPEATSRYSKPLAAMRAFLAELDAAPDPVAPTRRCLAALGPEMLELSAERSLGAHT